MHAYDIPKYFNKTDVYNLQKRFGKHKDRINNTTGQRKPRDGKPDVLFIPATLKLAGDKFRELKSLVYDYRDKKEEEMKELQRDHEGFKKEIEKNKEDYEKIIEAAADEIENFVEKANLENPVQ